MEAGFSINASINTDFLAFFKPICNTRFAELDCKVADAIPPALSSGWCFDCRTLEAKSNDINSGLIHD
jgi:hypothetical protein